MHQEEVLLESPGIKITPTRVIINGTTYAVANITSIAAVQDTSKRNLGILLIVLGVLASMLIKLFGIIAVLIGVLLVIYGRIAILVLTTGAAERRALRSRDTEAILRVASAINLAIMKRDVASR